jgi:AcrR family transcriptional regulator
MALSASGDQHRAPEVAQYYPAYGAATMPSETSEKQERSDARRNREAVIDAALAVLPSDPSASMATIAETSGLGRTTVYRHFPARNDLILALFERVVAEARQVTSDIIGRGESASETLRKLGPAIISIAERFRFLAGMRDLGQEVISESTTDPNQPVRHFVEAAQRQGEIDPELPVQWILTAMNGLGLSASTEMQADRLTVEQAGQVLGETMVRAFAVDP